MSSSVGAPPVADRSICAGSAVSCAEAGAAIGAANNTDKKNVVKRRVMAICPVYQVDRDAGRAAFKPPARISRARGARCTRPMTPNGSAALLLVGGAPAPGPAAKAAGHDAFAVDA